MSSKKKEEQKNPAGAPLFVLAIAFAIAIVLLFRVFSKQDIAKNEKVAVETLRTLQIALDKYKQDNLFYPPALSPLASGLSATRYLDNYDFVSDEFLLTLLTPPGAPKIFIYYYGGYQY